MSDWQSPESPTWTPTRVLGLAHLAFSVTLVSRYAIKFTHRCYPALKAVGDHRQGFQPPLRTRGPNVVLFRSEVTIKSIQVQTNHKFERPWLPDMRSSICYVSINQKSIL